MDIIANAQEIVIVNRSLDYISYIDCIVTSIGHACLSGPAEALHNWSGQTLTQGLFN